MKPGTRRFAEACERSHASAKRRVPDTHPMPRHGFVRVAAAVPPVRVADPAHTAAHTLGLTERAEAAGVEVLVLTDLLFAAPGETEVVVGVEICEDVWTPVPPSSFQALAGATLLLNLSASNEVIGKAPYRRQLVAGQSARCLAAYVYASSGVTESTTDLVFGGHCLVGENGTILAESERFRRDETLLVADV